MHDGADVGPGLVDALVEAPLRRRSPGAADGAVEAHPHHVGRDHAVVAQRRGRDEVARRPRAPVPHAHVARCALVQAAALELAAQLDDRPASGQLGGGQRRTTSSTTASTRPAGVGDDGPDLLEADRRAAGQAGGRVGDDPDAGVGEPGLLRQGHLRVAGHAHQFGSRASGRRRSRPASRSAARWCTRRCPGAARGTPTVAAASATSARSDGEYGSVMSVWRTSSSKNVSARPRVNSMNWSMSTRSPGDRSSAMPPLTAVAKHRAAAASLQCPDVGPVVDPVRRHRVSGAVAGQEGDGTTVPCAAQDRRRAVRRVDHGGLGGVQRRGLGEARAGDDREHRPRDRNPSSTTGKLPRHG